MTKARKKPMFSLARVEFHDSAIAGRGVFAKQHFAPGDFVVPYAPKQRKLSVDDPEAIAAAATKLTLSSEGRFVIVPDTSTPGGWLCNHSCRPNAAIFSDDRGRVQCIRPIAPGEEITIFYGWISHNAVTRDPCLCGMPECRGFINFDVADEDVAAVDVRNGELVTTDARVRAKLEEYGEFLRSIGQGHVQTTIANVLASAKQGV